MNYIEEAIDSQCEYGRKYLELVSGCDYGDNLEVHHIVPVAYFSDVLGIKECRTSRSPDMARENLVSLSKGRHVLAHFYLAKCAKPCIMVQMRNAFCLTYQTTDFSKVTEEEVISRMDEINSEYGKMKACKGHKDGVGVRKTNKLITYTTWKGGEQCGPYMSRRHDGYITKMGINGERGIHWKFGDPEQYDPQCYFVVETEHYYFQVNLFKGRPGISWRLGTLPNYVSLCNNYLPGCYNPTLLSTFVKDFDKVDNQMHDIICNLPFLLRRMGYSVYANRIDDDVILSHVRENMGLEHSIENPTEYGVIDPIAIQKEAA